MNLIILGPQGCGKGTQAQLLADKFGWLHFEMGKILRSIAQSENNKYSKGVAQALNSGSLVPDEYVRLIAWDFVKKHQDKGIIFEGYPRSVDQYDHLQDMLRKFGKKLDFVINIDISEAESIARLEKRRTCNKCGKVYTGGTVCECGGQLVQREDDKPEAIRQRLQIYHAQTHPVFEKAVADGIGVEISGEFPIEIVHAHILEAIKNI